VLTLVAGLLAAVTGFALLTASVTTSELRVRKTVTGNFRGAYDILVRPAQSFTPLERDRGLVRDNYLSGIFGGISQGQWQVVLGLAGVQVAAPIANVGYVTPNAQVLVSVRPYLNGEPRQVLRVRRTWLADDGQSKFSDYNSYVYLTDNRIAVGPDPVEVIPGNPVAQRVCSGFDSGPAPAPRDPFDRGALERLTCLSTRFPDQRVVNRNELTAPADFIGTSADVSFPLLLAAIDPVQEDKLLKLSGAVTSGRGLTASDGVEAPVSSSQPFSYVPVIASSRLYLDDQLEATVERLHIPAGTDLVAKLASKNARRFLDTLPGTPVGRKRLGVQDAHHQLLASLAQQSKKLDFFGLIRNYWTAGAVTTTTGQQPDRLVAEAKPASDPASTWADAFDANPIAPPGNEDQQFRPITQRSGSSDSLSGQHAAVKMHVVGQFDPQRLPGFSELSRVPLETYYPPTVASADSGRPVLPTMNLGGYVAQPPLLLTTVKALARLTDPRSYGSVSGLARPTLSATAPISVIRVRVAGVTGPDKASQERIRRVAQAIIARTGLTVDVTVGSSPHDLAVNLPAGAYGRPAQTVREGWVQKGAAIAVLRHLDRKSLLLFVLILLVCGFFLVNSATASVRARRTEIGVLRTFGWTRGQVFRAVTTELFVVGAATGIAGAALSAALAASWHLRLSAVQILLVVPASAALATLAGLLPSWDASRGQPLDAVRPTVASGRKVARVRGLASLALATLRRSPGRTLIAAGALTVGVAALTALLGVDAAFVARISGTHLGNALTTQVRGVDYLGAGLAVGLGIASVADVLILSLRERTPELVTLKTFGWQNRHLARVALYEGLAVGTLGTVAGTVLGLSLAAGFGGTVAGGAVAIAAALLVGVGTTSALAVTAALFVGRLPAPTSLAAE
jgi:hypothetical protein